MENETHIEMETMELKERVIYALFLPVVRVAGVFDISLRDLKDGLSVAYLHEMKRNGYAQKESAEHMQVSRRTVIDLSKRLRRMFSRPERDIGLERRVLLLLWAESIAEGRLLQALKAEFEGEAVLEMLDKLVEEEKVRRVTIPTTFRYELIRNAFRFVEDGENWIARMDALNNQLSGLTDTIFARFFANDKQTFARTVALSVRKEDGEEFERFYREVIFPKLVELDAASQSDPKAVVFEMLLSWVPKDFISMYKKEMKNEDN